MKICLTILMVTGAVAARADVLGSATSDAVALDLGVATTRVEKLGFSETVSVDAQYSSTGMTARVWADGVELSAEAGKAVWTPTAVGVHTLTHQVLADGEVVGEERTVRREIWDDSVTIDRAETTLRTLLPTTFDRVTSVTVDSSVGELAIGALEGCTGLRNLTIANPNQTMASLMGEARSGVETIEIAEGTETLPENFFAGCSSLRSVKLPQSLKSMAGNNLRDVGKLMENREDGYWVESGWVLGYKGVCPPEIPASEQIKGVCDGALKGCMELKCFRPTGANLTYIGSEAFSGCMRLETIVFPDSLETIGAEAFYQCTRIQSAMIPGSVKSVGDGAFKFCTSLGPHGVGIAFGVEWIGKEAFYQDWRVEEVAFPSTVRFIGANAFGGDSSVSRVTVRADIRPLCEIFFQCEQIREAVVHPCDGIADKWCFSGFTELTNVYFRGDAPVLAEKGRLFYENTPETLVTYVDEESTGWDGVPGSLALPKAWPLDGTMRRAIAYGGAPTYEVTFDPNGGSQDVQVVRQNLEMPFALPSPPQRDGYTFNGWWTSPVGGWQVTDKTIFVPGAYQRLYAVWSDPEFVIVDGVLTQYNGPGGAVTIPEGVTSIGECAFEGRYDLNSVEIPEGVTNIGYFAFYFCDGLTSVTLPSGLTQIGIAAFAFCSSLEVIYVSGNGDIDAVKKLLAESGLDLDLVIFDSAENPTRAYYRVAFKANGGKGRMPQRPIELGRVVNLPNCTFKPPSGKRFAGWACSNGKRYDDGMLVFNLAEPGETVTMTAIWE